MAGCARPESTFDPKGKPVNPFEAIFTSNAQNNFSSLSDDNVIQLEEGKNATAKQRRKVFCKTFIPNRFTTNLNIL